MQCDRMEPPNGQNHTIELGQPGSLAQKTRSALAQPDSDAGAGAPIHPIRGQARRTGAASDTLAYAASNSQTLASRQACTAASCRQDHCMNQPWLTTSDCPVRALESKAAKNRTASATSSTVVNSPSTVSFSMTFFTTSASVMPSSFACSGICLSASGVRTKPGQTTLARTPCAAPSLATTLARPTSPCLAVT